MISFGSEFSLEAFEELAVLMLQNLAWCMTKANHANGSSSVVEH